MQKVYLDDGQLKKLDKVVANCEDADGNDEPSARHLEIFFLKMLSSIHRSSAAANFLPREVD